MKPLMLFAAVLAALAGVTAAAQSEAPPYVAAEGNKVDARTLEGWRTWRAMACERCHGPNQEGMVGPSLVESLRHMTQEEFKATVLNGRIEKGMPNFGGSELVVKNIDGLYGFLKARSDGAIRPGRLEELKP